MSIRIGIGKNLSPGSTPIPAYESEIMTYIAGLITPLSDGQLTLLNNFVLTLKSGMGITTLDEVFDALWIIAGETEESSLRNLIKDDHHCNKIGLPVFTALEGFEPFLGNYLQTDYIPSSDGVRFLQDDAGMGVYQRKSRLESSSKWAMGSSDASTLSSILTFRTATTARVYSNNLTAITLAVTDNLGITSVHRYGAALTKGARNKTLGALNTNASISPPSTQGYIGCTNLNGAINGPDDAQVSMGWYSKSLISAVSQANLDCLVDAFETYMDANGKGVIP